MGWICDQHVEKMQWVCSPYYQVSWTNWGTQPLSAAQDQSFSNMQPYFHWWGSWPSEQSVDRAQIHSPAKYEKVPTNKTVNEAVVYLLSQPAGVPVDAPWAKGHPTLGDCSLDHPFVEGSESLGPLQKKDLEIRIIFKNPGYETPRENVYHLEADASSTCRLPKDGDVVGVSSKWADIPVDPGDSSLLVPQAVVSWWLDNGND